MNSTDPVAESSVAPADDIRDELPEDLQPEFAGAYQFPDNSRRRIPGYLYLTLAVGCFAWYATSADSSAIVNGGTLWAGILLTAVGLFSISSGWRMHVDERDALVAAQQAIGFPVGHASAQQVWHGIRSRPTWRVFCYSAEEPPLQRGLVLVDAVDGRVLQHLAEPNPELDTVDGAA
ncbi:MAG: hypothetical protein RIB65_05830 [Ilumatobacter fluminis]|uniref:hypothetical protein n=1 Tax=Ilumatobacter fluminis TaxID=467091 RepID=UPI0032ED8664